jgi:NADH-quinone oxidoreductase subunit M
VLLTIIIALPLLGVLISALLPHRAESGAKWVALLVTGADFVLAAWQLVQRGITGTTGMQLETSLSWIPQLSVHYHIGVDGLSLPLLVLSTLLCFLAVLASWKITVKPRFYFAMLCLLSLGLNGVFTALDLVLFYVFWEVVLVPMYFLISQWGGERRQYASIKFFLYTFFGSVFMLVAIVALYLYTGSFDLTQLRDLIAQTAALKGAGIGSIQWWLFGAFFLGFAVKVPIWPLHTWLPDAHVEAPTAGSVLLAGIMLKMGTYGFLRISVPLLPQGFSGWQLILGILAVISIVYGAVVAFAQKDVKKLVAYSSVSHMGFAMLGIAAGTAEGFNAAMAVNISHGLCTGMLFLLVGMVYERTHTRQIKDLSGIAAQMPVYAGIFCFASFASMGLPLLSGFVGEFLTMVGSWKSPALPGIITVIAGLGILCGGAYMLWLMQRMIFGNPTPAVEGQPDITLREILCVVPLAALVLVIGLSWNTLLQFTDPFAAALVKILGA